MNRFISEMDQEYQEFMSAERVAPPQEVTERVFSRVRRDLDPNAWLVFSKMALIHFASGVVTLSLCPQFGVRVFGEGLGLMKYFMVFGRYGCIAVCGAFFIGASLLLAGMLLRREEVRKLRNRSWLQVSAIVFLSLGALIMADAEILFGFGLAWIVGSLAGGLAMLELSWLVRRPAIAA